MKTIWKFPIATVDQQSLPIPAGAEMLCVQVQHGEPCIWALVNPDAPKRRRAVRVVGTGHPCDDVNAQNYVGTYQLHDGRLVFHVFIAPEEGEGR
jgi:hypothetical protein